LNAKKYDCGEDLTAILNQYLEQWEALYGDVKKDRAVEQRLEYVIRRAYERTGKRVVVLIDEYDKPMLQVMDDQALTEDYRKTLKAFYGVLKSSADYLRFVFITGVTKFAQVSVFSDLNQLQDISMAEQYAELCGITQDELVHTFTPELEQMAAKNGLTFDETIRKMTCKYDGYHFSKGAVAGMFNPFSVLNALSFKDFGDYWFQTGTPTYLVELLKHSDYDIRGLVDGIELKSSSFSEYRADPTNPIPMIYQSGYLTIKGYDPMGQLYTLGFPNDEVRYGFLEFLAPYYSNVNDTNSAFYIVQFYRDVQAGRIDEFMERLKVFYAKIPYELSIDTEKYYQAVFYIVFTLLGQYVEAEVRSATGRADAVVKTKDYIYLFEFKLKGTAEEALRQIDEKGYLLPYQLDGRQTFKIGAEFSKETRNVNRWLVA
jgi:hypothetical protein